MFFGIRPVASETVVDQDRSYLSLIVNLGLRESSAFNDGVTTGPCNARRNKPRYKAPWNEGVFSEETVRLNARLRAKTVIAD